MVLRYCAATLVYLPQSINVELAQNKILEASSLVQLGKGRSAGFRCIPLIAEQVISIISSGFNKARIIQILNSFSRVSWWWGTTLTKTLVTRNIVPLYCESQRKSRKPCMRMAKPESYSSNEAYSICSGTLKEERPARVSASRTLSSWVYQSTNQWLWSGSNKTPILISWRT